MSIRLDHGEDALDEVHEINVTPFIDVLLVLLIIFTVAAPLATVDILVNLPASTAEPATAPERYHIQTLRLIRICRAIGFRCHPVFDRDGVVRRVCGGQAGWALTRGGF